MTALRKPVFDAIRAEKGSILPAEVSLIDELLDQLGFTPVAPLDALKPSQAAFKAIAGFEGCRLVAYPDPGSGGDPWTIGYGATGSGIARGAVWTQAQADARLASDIARFGTGVAALLHGCITSQHEFDALTSFAFNLGLKALADSTLLRKHCRGDKAGTAAEFHKWVYASGRKLPGLVKRRAAEARMYQGLST